MEALEAGCKRSVVQEMGGFFFGCRECRPIGFLAPAPSGFGRRLRDVRRDLSWVLGLFERRHAVIGDIALDATQNVLGSEKVAIS